MWLWKVTKPMVDKDRTVKLVDEDLQSMKSFSQASLSSGQLASCICNTEVIGKTMLVGFPGHGLVGSIAAKYIIKSLELEVVGYVRSVLIPPMAVFLDGVLAYPYRIYGDPKKRKSTVVLIGESPAPPSAYYFLANAVLDWAVTHIGAEEIICLDGFPDSRNEPEVYVVAEPDIKERFTEYKKPQTGYIGGLSGAILNETIIREIDGYALLVSTTSQFPDPIGAAELIKVLNDIKGWKIDVKPLIEDGEKIKKTMQEFADKTRQLSDGSSSDSGVRESLYL